VGNDGPFYFQEILTIEACRVAGIVAEPDPGSTAFLTPGSGDPGVGVRDGKNLDPAPRA
jgi:hypothetical protein